MFHFSKNSIRVNDEQATAIRRPPGVHQRILASAGSGKTTTLTARLAYLIESCGVAAESIVLMTFSRNAAQQMKTRIESLVGPQKIWAGTFHGLSRALLKKFSPEALKALYFVDELVNMGETWLGTLEGRKWVGRLRYVVVDEFQDINEEQWKMLQRMLHPGARLIIVGDDCQNIYTWRGSHVKYILELHTQVRGLVDDQLRRNYRSRESLIKVANTVMQRIPTLEWKGTMLPEKMGGEKPHVHFFYRLADESRWILKTVEEYRKVQPKMSIAILSRTNGDLYRIEEEMMRSGMRCRLRDIGVDEEHGSGEAVVDLVTLHASKGLEWDLVFLVNCNDDVFPSSKKPENVICERRLFYVGVTRAREILHFSYTRDERALCRFVREVPSQLMTYHGLARFCLSEVEVSDGKKRLKDLIGALDGDQLQKLREDGILSWLDRVNLVSEPVFRGGEVWKTPSWAVGDHLGDFHRFLRIWILRHIAFTVGTPFRETLVERMLFTLRIYSEDRAFWETWSHELSDCIFEFFSGSDGVTERDPPSIDYTMISAWASTRHLPWGPTDLIRATSIVAKIRGQLRPLRFESYQLREFRMAPSRYVVPTEWRADALRSWRRICDKSVSWKECLVDMWKMGAMALVAEGRNAAMYRATLMSTKLGDDELNEYLECLDLRLSEWLAKRQVIGLSEQFTFQEYRESVDLHTEGSFLKIADKMETQELVSLAVTSWFAKDLNNTSVGIFVPIEGRFYTISLPEAWNLKAERLFQVMTSS
jgi:hypothetical protein